MSPMVSQGAKLGLIEPAAFHQTECFEAARLFAQTEGIIPAPETSHAICGAVKEAIRCREANEEKCIVFNLSGHGLCDMASYDRFLGGHLEDYAYPKEKIDEALAELPAIE
jgi:tryptophan synthase beta chain